MIYHNKVYFFQRKEEKAVKPFLGMKQLVCVVLEGSLCVYGTLLLYYKPLENPVPCVQPMLLFLMLSHIISIPMHCEEIMYRNKEFSLFFFLFFLLPTSSHHGFTCCTLVHLMQQHEDTPFYARPLSLSLSSPIQTPFYRLHKHNHKW